jgi:phage terminase large subunit-like protein
MCAASPVAALYEQVRGHHVGHFPELEEQLCSFTPKMPKSPDRADAMIWAAHELIVQGSSCRSSR